MNRLIYIAVILAAMLQSCDDQLPPKLRTANAFAKILYSENRIAAGTQLKTIEVETDGINNGQILELIINKSWGTKIIQTKIENDAAIFKLNGLSFEQRGEIELVLIYNGSELDNHILEVTPGVANGLVESYLGPKTIFVGGEDRSMLTNVVTDKYGNVVNDGTEVHYSYRYPSATTSSQSRISNHLVSFLQLTSGMKTGKLIIGATSGESFIREQEIKITPSYPSNISIEVVELFPYADSRQTIWLRTKVIKDRFDNVVADGTIVDFIVEERGIQISRYKSYTIGGIANGYIENPKIETSWNVYAQSREDVQSNRLTLDFESNVESIKFAYNQENHSIAVGPIVAELGQHVQDGTSVNLTIQRGNKELQLHKESLNGYCEFKLEGKRFVKGAYDLALEIGGERSSKKLVIR